MVWGSIASLPVGTILADVRSNQTSEVSSNAIGIVYGDGRDFSLALKLIDFVGDGRKSCS